MIYIESPNKDDITGYVPRLFLAGGITHCPDWQKGVVGSLVEESIIIYNPRRKDFSINNPDEIREQIEWEYNCFRNVCDMAVFWFSKGSLNPIVLYELGRWVNSGYLNIDKVFIGIDEGYERRKDVEIQTGLDFKGIKISKSIDDLCERIKKYLKLNSEYIKTL